jgi:hypothetical protein
MSAICQYCSIAISQVKSFEMEIAERFPEQENLGGAGISACGSIRAKIRCVRGCGEHHLCDRGYPRASF